MGRVSCDEPRIRIRGKSHIVKSAETLEARVESFAKARGINKGEIITHDELRANRSLFEDLVTRTAYEREQGSAKTIGELLWQFGYDTGYSKGKPLLSDEVVGKLLREAFYRGLPVSKSGLLSIPKYKKAETRLESLARAKRVTRAEMFVRLTEIPGLHTEDLGNPEDGSMRQVGTIGERLVELSIATALTYDPSGARMGSAFRSMTPVPLHGYESNASSNGVSLSRPNGEKPHTALSRFADFRMDGGANPWDESHLIEVKTGMLVGPRGDMVETVGIKYPKNVVWASDDTRPNRRIAVLLNPNGNAIKARENLKKFDWQVITGRQARNMYRATEGLLAECSPGLPQNSSVPFYSFEMLRQAFEMTLRQPYVLAGHGMSTLRDWLPRMLRSAVDGIMNGYEEDRMSVPELVYSEVHLPNRVIGLDDSIFIDIETASDKPRQGAPVFIAGIARASDKNTLRISQRIARTPLEERLLLEWLKKELSGASNIVGHNIRGFDMPYLLNRYAAWRMKPFSMDRLVVTDTLPWLRLHKVDYNIGSARLSEYAMSRGLPVVEVDVPLEYARLIAGEEGDVCKVIDRNKSDLLAVAAMYADTKKT
jgi:hypothetical protein